MSPYSLIAASAVLSTAQQGVNKLKEKAIEEYKLALTMPRKKKKQAKKSALLLLSIACYGEEILNF